MLGTLQIKMDITATWPVRQGTACLRGPRAEGQSLSVLLSECQKGIWNILMQNLVAYKHGRKKTQKLGILWKKIEYLKYLKILKYLKYWISNIEIFEKSIIEKKKNPSSLHPHLLPNKPAPRTQTTCWHSSSNAALGRWSPAQGFSWFVVCLSLGGISKKYFCSSSRLLHKYKNYPCVNFYSLDKIYCL